MDDKLLEVKGLVKHFATPGGIVHAVDNVTFSVARGETLGIVGESGCGKSTTGRCVLRLIEPTDGEVFFQGVDICKVGRAQMKRLRREMQIIFQDPYSSLNPRRTVMEIIAEPLKLNKIIPNATKSDIENYVMELMDTVGLAQRLTSAYPHELDGGRRQRIGIARALAMNPKLVVCDEPVSALDVSIQAQILNLLRKLQKERDLTYIFITHDLSVVNHFSKEIIVMYLGKIIEKAHAQELFKNPLHPYTKALLSSVLIPKVDGHPNRIYLRGEVTSPLDPPDECRFIGRCNEVCPKCKQGIPALKEVSPDHFVACHLIQ